MRWWLAALAVAAMIFALSSMPARDLGPTWIGRYDKVIHGAVYALLGGLCAAGGVARGWPRGVIVALAIVLATAYGASDEWHQRFTPGRDSSLGDLAADAIGATIGAIAVATLMYRRRRA